MWHSEGKLFRNLEEIKKDLKARRGSLPRDVNDSLLEELGYFRVTETVPVVTAVQTAVLIGFEVIDGEAFTKWDIRDRFQEYTHEVDGETVTVTKEAQEAAYLLSIDPLAERKASKHLDMIAGYNREVAMLIGNSPESEMASWPTQAEEAKAFQADPMSPTPLLSGLVVSRGFGETVEDLVVKVLSKAQLYAENLPIYLGKLHAKQKAIETATTLLEVEEIVW